MGYYSDVVITLKRDDMAELHRSAKGECEKAYDLLKYGMLHADGYDDVTWSIECVKWYDGFEDVDFIMDFIKRVNTYAFKRIGEDPGDIEVEIGDNDASWDLEGCTNYVSYFEVPGDEISPLDLM